MGAVPIRSTTYRVNLGPVDVVMITRQQQKKKKEKEEKKSSEWDTEAPYWLDSAIFIRANQTNAQQNLSKSPPHLTFFHITTLCLFPPSFLLESSHTNLLHRYLYKYRADLHLIHFNPSVMTDICTIHISIS